ncbi:hypothetical protein DAPPUDRAFT_323011 [Daphnia pulex]|uniref:Peptidase S1 domain-containing protein n=1 Tax=Daphnia pulex TaxID=6669 RepID=E9GXN6_DAPPU|nr:hypothetical protein DAPPUDRAFT_323011 [Daphnia pulex]|eukprot:EFX75692.1 hypothetical protein DAPPUDRAFT_323011 [Daphnia pulex]
MGSLTYWLDWTFQFYGVQIGVTSFGNGCADPKYCGVYTRSPLYVSWIKTTMTNNCSGAYCNLFLAANILFSGEVSFWSGVELALN